MLEWCIIEATAGYYISHRWKYAVNIQEQN